MGENERVRFIPDTNCFKYCNNIGLDVAHGGKTKHGARYKGYALVSKPKSDLYDDNF
jgi:peroxiredoxin